MLVGWLLRLLLLVLVIRAIWRLARGVLQGLAAGQAAAGGRVPGRDGSNERAVPLVRDPVCGTYVVRDRAIAVRSATSAQVLLLRPVP